MRELRHQFASALLVVLTVAVAFSAFLNFEQNFHPKKKFRLADDGVTWLDRQGRIEATHVRAGGPGARVGIRAGDVLVAIGGVPLDHSLQVAPLLNGPSVGAWRPVKYQLQRKGIEFTPEVLPETAEPPRTLPYQYLVGAAYLLIGVFVYYRRGSAPKALHFFLLCLASFVLSTFHYTGKLNTFDKIVYWSNVAAGLLAPTIFLHFCLTFPGPHLRRRFHAAFLYAPAAILGLLHVAVARGWVKLSITLLESRWALDQVELLYLSVAYLAGAGVLWVNYRRAGDPVVRQQLRWLRNGALVGVLPFAALYAIPYALGVTPTAWMSLAVLSLPMIPLTWAYAIVRYRLMDVDIIFQQGYAYTLATLTVLGVAYGLFFSIGKFDELNPTAVVALILLAAFFFQPIRNWMQELLDRHVFYKDRYDYRRTLLAFARQLGTQTDLDEILTSTGDRLLRTLSVQQVAFFLHEGQSEGVRHGRAGAFSLRRRMAHEGLTVPIQVEPHLDLSFLPVEPERPYLFFEHTRVALDVVSRDVPASVRRTVADLGLTYYIPCIVRGRAVAYLGLSRSMKNDFLSSDDIELLLTLCDYVGMAIENWRLYTSLQAKVQEFERLKEFSENIVESVNVGILAADLRDRVESWNQQMELLTGVPREAAVGKPLAELFPAELCAQFDRARQTEGIHNAYKLVVRAGPKGPQLVSPDGPVETEPTLAGGRELILNLAIAPLVTRDGEQVGRLIILDDVTDQSEMERQLVQADKLSSIGLLAAGVAHEVNTPLAVISTYSQLLAKQVTGDAQKAMLLEKIAKQTFRASEIVNSLLSFSRTAPTELVEVHLNRVLRETVTLVQHQLDKARVRVEWELEDVLPPIKGNANKLQQVFLNLVLNARDAMAEGGTVTVRSWTDDGRVVIEVADTGHGIAADHLPRIFDPFFTTKGTKKGTGLGLSVTYGIVQEHSGTIEARSDVSQGTCFRLEFPTVRKAAVA